LSLSLGNSHQAVATVVGSMMAGLFLGSLAATRFLPRIKNLPSAYGVVEMAVGSYAALTPLLFMALPLVLGPVYSTHDVLFPILRFLLVFTLLLPASGGMGATLPILTAALSRPGGEPSGSGGRLYGINTLGAFLGTLAGGFLFLPGLGLLKSTFFGAALSLSVGSLAYYLSGKALLPRGKGSQGKDPLPAPSGNTSWILPMYAVSGCLPMTYEITWTRILAPIVGISVYSFTLILAAILGGIGLGSLALSTRRAATLDPARGFVAGQILLGLTAFLSTWGLKAFPNLMLSAAVGSAGHPALLLLWEFSLLALIVLLPGALLGALFPFASSLLRRLEKEAGAEVGRVYAWNTAGSIAGTLAAGSFLVEALGSERTLILASTASVLLGLAGLTLSPGRLRLAQGHELRQCREVSQHGCVGCFGPAAQPLPGRPRRRPVSPGSPKRGSG
jgi:spermidine synthase